MFAIFRLRRRLVLEVDGLERPPREDEALPLYRAQALSEASSRFGAPIRPLGVSSWVLVAFLLGGLALAGWFLATTTFARKETVQGQLLPSSGAIRMTSLRAGVVRQVYVRGGEQVQANAPLLAISVDSSVDGGQPVGALLSQAIDAHASALRRQSSAGDDAARQLQRDIGVRREGLARQIESLVHQDQIEDDRIALAKEAVDAAEKLLSDNLITEQEFRTRREAYLAQSQNASRVRQELFQARSEMAQLGVEAARVRAQGATEDAKIAGEEAELLSKRAQVLAQQDIIINASAAGKIAALQVKPGQPIEAGATIAILLPKAAKLEAHLWIPSRAAGFVRPGDEVKLMYAAFPYQRFGLSKGRVIAVADAPISDTELPMAPRSPGRSEELYEVIVAVDRQSVQAYGRTWPLLSGMSLNADLVIERQSLWTWVTDPLRATATRHEGK
jgi:membrane fusion protein